MARQHRPQLEPPAGLSDRELCTERFDNPYSQWAFGSPQVTIRRGEETLVLDLGRTDSKDRSIKL